MTEKKQKTSQPGLSARLAELTKKLERLRHLEAAHRLSQIRLETLVQLSRMDEASDQEIVEFVLDEGVRLTGSQYGHIFFMSEDEAVMRVYSWSEQAVKDCRVQDAASSYDLDNAGLSGESVRQRRAVVVNDYQAPNPLKRGLPPGHIPIIRYLNLPVFDGGRIVAVAGLANKEQGYDESDVNHLSLLMDGMWRQLQKRRTEKSIKASEERFREMAESIDQIFWILDVIGRRFVYISPAAEKIWGWPVSRMMNSFDDFLGDVHPDDRAKVLHVWTKPEDYLEAMEFRLRHRRGDYRWLRSRPYSVRDSSGKIIRQVGVAEDFTEHKAADEERERLVQAVRQAAEIILITDPEGLIQFANPAAAILSADELKGRNVAEILGTINWNQVKELLDGRNTGASATPLRLTLMGGHGRRLQLDAVVSPIMEPSGKAGGWVYVMRDVTYEAELEKHLRQTQKMEALGTLAGGIAHDFNNILGTIIGCTELAAANLTDPDKVRGMLENTLASAERARDIVRQILIFARVTDQPPEPVCLASAVRENLRLVRASLPSTLEIRQNMEAEEAAVLSHPAQIHQVLLNLCTNAAQALHEKGGGVITVGVDELYLDGPQTLGYGPNLTPGPYVRLTVADDGPGIPEDIQSRIFEPFFTTKEPGRGTGLGLSTIHGILAAQFGAVRVHSLPGQGASFEALWPKISAAPARALEPGPDEPPGGHERILLVDDEESLAHVFSNILESLGYRVTALTSSREALEIFSQKPEDFDLVLTDMTMPYLKGSELARKLLTIKPDLPIILFTGYAETITPEKARAMGIREYVFKPVKLLHLAGVIRRVLDNPPPPRT